MMKTSGSIDMSFPPAGIHKPAKSDFNNSCMNLTCPPSSLFFCACAKTLSRACMYTPACAQTHAFASTVFLLMPNQRPWNLFTAVLLESPPIFQFQICFKWTWRTVCGYSRLVLLQKQWSSGPLIIFFFLNLLFYSVTGQQILINYGVLCLNVCHVGLL